MQSEYVYAVTSDIHAIQYTVYIAENVEPFWRWPYAAFTIVYRTTAEREHCIYGRSCVPYYVLNKANRYTLCINGAVRFVV
jgi:hypothetical protein